MLPQSQLSSVLSAAGVALAARALDGSTEPELDRLLDEGPLPRLTRKLRDFSESLRYEEAARLRDRIAALESVQRDLVRLRELRSSELLLIVPSVERDIERLVVVSRGRVAAVRSLWEGGKIDRALAEARLAEPSLAPTDSDELLLIASFLRRPPPELTVIRRSPCEVGLSAVTALA